MKPQSTPLTKGSFLYSEKSYRKNNLIPKEFVKIFWSIGFYDPQKFSQRWPNIFLECFNLLYRLVRTSNCFSCYLAGIESLNLFAYITRYREKIVADPRDFTFRERHR